MKDVMFTIKHMKVWDFCLKLDVSEFETLILKVLLTCTESVFSDCLSSYSISSLQ